APMTRRLCWFGGRSRHTERAGGCNDSDNRCCKCPNELALFPPNRHRGMPCSAACSPHNERRYCQQQLVELLGMLVVTNEDGKRKHRQRACVHCARHAVKSFWE